MRQKKPKLLDADALWNYALQCLGRRACSVGELRERIHSRAAKKTDVDPILARLKDYGYLSDQKFAEGYAHARLENEGMGKHRVLSELRKRRVAPTVAERAVERLYQDTDEIQLAEEFLRRKYRNACREGFLSERKDLASAYGRLRRAGFTSAVTVQVLKRFAKDPDLLDLIEETPEVEGE